jgi:hypothetical protein
MVTFLMLRQQSCQGVSCTIHINSPEYPVMPCPSPTDPSICVLPSPKDSSVPALHTFTFSTNDKMSGQRVRRSASLPNIPLCILPRRTPVPSTVPQHGPMAPCLLGSMSLCVEGIDVGTCFCILHFSSWHRRSLGLLLACILSYPSGWVPVLFTSKRMASGTWVGKGSSESHERQGWEGSGFWIPSPKMVARGLQSL